MARTAIVAGGGIGGLAAAVALTRRGWRVEVLERAAAAGEAGSGRSLWPNGVRALTALGLAVPSTPPAEGGGRDRSGRWLSRTDTAEVSRRYRPLAVEHRFCLTCL